MPTWTLNLYVTSKRMLEYIRMKYINDLGVRERFLKHSTKSLKYKKIKESDYIKLVNISSWK